MALKALLITDPECLQRCDSARGKLDLYLKNGEVTEMSVGAAMDMYELGEPVGVPFLAIVSESSKECIAQVYIAGEDVDEPNEGTTV